MFLVDQLILLAAVLALAGIVSSKASSRLGLPVLVLFLFVGMAAGEDGWGIAFDNPAAAHALGTLALALILFDGGLQTSFEAVRSVWKPAGLLASVGVLVTALVTGLVAVAVLDLPLLEGLLLGSIVGSTDAAAVFSMLRSAGLRISRRVKSTLEIESASNDPMAIFLTIGLLEVLVNGMEPGTGLLEIFVLQFGVGSIAGLAVGAAAVAVINRIHLAATGLYPVLVLACGFLAFGLAANFGGSGFLAIFLAGVVVGNSRFVFQRGTYLFQDGLAWCSQIGMFVMLGLLVTPSKLLEVWAEGLAIACALIFVARPLAVALLLLPFGFGKREIALLSWGGLRGSVPIILALFPFLLGLSSAPLIFNVVFFVVLVSAVVQGSTLMWLARRLGLAEAPLSRPAATLDITSIGDVNADIVEYTLDSGSRAAGRRISQLALPDGTVVAMITRQATVIPPRGSTLLEAHDHLFVVLRRETRPFVDLVFAAGSEAGRLALPGAELRLKGTTRVEDVLRSYGIRLDADDTLPLGELVLRALPDEDIVGASVTVGVWSLRVCERVGPRVSTVGLSALPTPRDSAPRVEATVPRARGPAA